ncbi:MAG: fumarylacetoacetate hydrolase family protein [Candidatus Lokiarchaeota archaeon]|nr:fumarylacetoacetate hydrolase family protein [Candidatus Lokiarchaeota archaeon]
MRLVTLKLQAGEQAAIVTRTGYLPVADLADSLHEAWPVNMLDIITSGALEDIKRWYAAGGKNAIQDLRAKEIPATLATFGPPFRHPPKIWGIGLNYADHAGDLASTGRMPSGIPGSFMKADTTIIGPGDAVMIPEQSQSTTGEGELGIVIGKRCKDIGLDNWVEYVAGFTTIIDMTAEDILKQNTRYLTVCKNFDTFFSFGPELVTPDEIPDVMHLHVATVINGRVHAANVISNMEFPLAFLVSFHSKVMTLLPGDIISTGTPRAVQIHDGDVIECRIDGFMPLKNPVLDLKRKRDELT